MKPAALALALAALAFAPSPAPAAGQTRAAAARVSVQVLDQTWRDAARSRELPVRIYLPAGPGPHPAVVVSHGLGGSRAGLAYMGRALANAGYLALHVQHPGSDVEAARSGPGTPLQNLATAALAPEAAADRFRDVGFALDELLRRERTPGPLHAKVDEERLAILGHSFGAITALAAAGQVFPGGETFRDERVKAAVAFSPSPPRRGSSQQAFGEIKVPVLMFTGTADRSPIDDFPPQRRQEPFQALSRTWRMLVVFDGADHAAFGGRARAPRDPPDAAVQAEVIRITTAFLDAVLLGRRERLEEIKAAGGAGLTVSGRVHWATREVGE